MWVYARNSETWVNYSGNNTAILVVLIWNSEIRGEDAIADRGFRSVTFSKGNAAKSWNDGENADDW
jgi:hypothetical protein